MLLTLDDEEALDPALAGGKGSGLARLHQAGLPVPASFVVPSTAWTAYFDQPALTQQRQRLFAADPSDRAQLYAQLKEKARATPLPSALTRGAMAALTHLGRSVAFRSSAVIEDGRDRSCAGMLSSHLGLPPTLRAFEAGVKAVWLSLLAPRTLEYLTALGETDLNLATARGCAVLVQSVVPADRSGVLFRTAGHVRVEAVPGLGLPLVAGQMSPDVFEQGTGSGWQSRVQPFKRCALVLSEPHWADLLPGDSIRWRKGATEDVAVLARYGESLSLLRLGYPADTDPLLAVEECEGLADLSARVSEVVGLPELDLEWCWCGPGPIALQARPITASIGAFGLQVTSGMAAAPGVARGVLWEPGAVTSPPAEPFILLVREIAPDHIGLVALASGVITRIGGMLSHGAIVCRELRKPLIVADVEAMGLASGQRIEMDGNTGVARQIDRR